jgi:hypothetical protein
MFAGDPVAGAFARSHCHGQVIGAADGRGWSTLVPPHRWAGDMIHDGQFTSVAAALAAGGHLRPRLVGSIDWVPAVTTSARCSATMDVTTRPGNRRTDIVHTKTYVFTQLVVAGAAAVMIVAPTPGGDPIRDLGGPYCGKYCGDYRGLSGDYLTTAAAPVPARSPAWQAKQLEFPAALPGLGRRG